MSPSAASDAPLLTAKALTREFDEGTVKALRGVDFTINEGEFVAVTGPSGCGKSTLLQLLGALDRPTSGTLLYRGESVPDNPDPAGYRASEVGFIFQAFHLLPTFTAAENVQIPMFESNRSLSERHERALELLRLVGLEDRFDHFPAKLSGGERQRVAVARSLANEPSLLLADEPTGNLDSENAHSVLDLIIRLQQEQGRTMVLVTHDCIYRGTGRENPAHDRRTNRLGPGYRGQRIMTFFTVVIRGLLRRPLRTGFTLAGISLGIAAVVALVGMARGFEKSWQVGLKARGTDIVVSNKSGSLTPKPFDASVRDRIANLPHIAATCNLLVEITSVEDSDLMILSAREWGGFSWNNLELVSGRMPRDATEEAVVLGQTAAEILHKKVGDPIQIETKELKVVGIVKGGALVEDGSVILSLPLLQGILGSPNQINAIDVRVTPSTTEEQLKQLTRQIQLRVPQVRAVTVSEHLSHNEGFRLVRAMSWGTSLLALLVGILGVMNTMLMTVFERTHEICVLLAVGWTRRRIIRMVLYESALLGLFGGIIGVIFGVIGVRLLDATPALRGLLQPDLGLSLLGFSVIIAIAVGVLSGIYPAWRSSRLTPSLALQAG